MPEPQPSLSLSAESSGPLFIFLKLTALFCGMTAIASGLTLEWDANMENDIGGYKVHYGTDKLYLSNIRDAGQATSCVLGDLAPGTTYYFAVQAYNTFGLHGPLSAPIMHTTSRADSGVVNNAAGEPMPVRGGKIQLGFVNPGAICEARTLTFTNNGSVILTNLSFALTGEAAGDFKVTGNPAEHPLLASSLKPGESITFGIAFSPGGGGLREAVLTLTADQSEVALFETTLSGNGSVLFEPWLVSNGAAGGPNGNPDGDALNNLFEYAFGTNPTVAQATTVAAGAGGQLASRGAPGVRVQTTPVFQFRGLFARRKNHAKAGLIYQTQFSADLKVWVDSTATPVVDGGDNEIEAVSVSAPATINGQVPRFFRVGVLQKSKLPLPSWLAAHGAGGGENDNPDCDGLNNFLEFAFGTDPSVAQSKPAAETNGLLVSRGAPTVRLHGNPGASGFEFSGLFCRRKDRAAHGIAYKPQFSGDLIHWVDATEAPIIRADDGEVEVVSVSAPTLPGGGTARFFRVALSQKNPAPGGEIPLPQEMAAADPHGNPDGDGLNNLLEFAFGTNPNASQSSEAREADGQLASRGAPNARIVTEPEFQFSGLFCRRKDRASKGLVYTPQFSHNLKSWFASPYPSVVRADDGEIEVVSVQAPNSINGMPARFFRVTVSIAP